jgi:hypothetical protein
MTNDDIALHHICFGKSFYDLYRDLKKSAKKLSITDECRCALSMSAELFERISVINGIFDNGCGNE